MVQFLDLTGRLSMTELGNTLRHTQGNKCEVTTVGIQVLPSSQGVFDI